MAFTPITVTREYLQPNLQAAAGKVTFTPTSPMVNDGTVIAAPATFQLAAGQLTAILAANDDPDTLPVDVAYLVREQIDGQVERRYYVEIPYNAAGGTVDLSTLAAVGVAPTVVFPTPVYTDEQVRDVVGAALVEGANVGIAVDDATNTITIAAPMVGATCRITASSTGQTLAADDIRIVDLDDATRNDDPTVFTVELADDRIKVLQAGSYVVHWALRLAAATSGSRYSSVAVNGKYNTVAEVGRTTGELHTQSSSSPIRLAANDYVNLCAYVDGASVGVESSQPFHTWLAIVRVGD